MIPSPTTATRRPARGTTTHGDPVRHEPRSGLLPRLASQLFSCFGAGMATAEPHAFGLPASTVPDTGTYLQRQWQVEQALARFVSHPGLEVVKEFGDFRCEVQLRHPLADPPSFGSPVFPAAHVMRQGEHFFKCDKQLNGPLLSTFNPFNVLRESFAQTVTARLGRGPAASIAVVPAQRVVEQGDECRRTVLHRPVAITASARITGKEICLREGSQVQDLMASEEAAPVLALAYLLNMNDVFKPERPAAHNLMRDQGSGRLLITDGFDGSQPQLKLCMLRERSIRRLFGMEREAMMEIIEESSRATAGFARRNAAALAHKDPQMAERKDITEPGQVFARYLDGCKRRLAELDD